MLHMHDEIKGVMSLIP